MIAMVAMMTWLNSLIWLLAWPRRIFGVSVLEPVPSTQDIVEGACPSQVLATGTGSGTRSNLVERSGRSTANRPAGGQHPLPVPIRWVEQDLSHEGQQVAALCRLIARPKQDANSQAAALLQWLQRRLPPGALLEAWYVQEVCYPQFIAEKGWYFHPWSGRKGVGKFLGEQPGVRKLSPYLETDYGLKDQCGATNSRRAALRQAPEPLTSRHTAAQLLLESLGPERV